MKYCSKCKENKPLKDFRPSDVNKAVIGCRSCMNAYEREKLYSNKERLEKKHKKQREYYADNLNSIKNYRSSDKYRGKRNKARRERRKNDPQYRISHNLRERIRKTLQGKIKSAKSFELLGCSTEQYKEYLERKFLSGMSWDNYGEWHIDHIRPIASFDLTDEIQQKQCFHFSNTQPLWKLDNLKKGNKN